MFNLGAEKLLVIFFIALLVVGPDKLPDLARKAGKALGDLRRMSGGFQDELRRALDEPLQTFTREFNNPGSVGAAEETAAAPLDGVEVSAAASPADQSDTPVEPSIDEDAAVATPESPRPPEGPGTAMKPVPTVLPDTPGSGEASEEPAPAKLPDWVFGTASASETPQFH